MNTNDIIDRLRAASAAAEGKGDQGAWDVWNAVSDLLEEYDTGPRSDSILAIDDGESTPIGVVIEALDLAKGHRVRATINYEPFPEHALNITGKCKGWVPAGGSRQWSIGGRVVRPHHVKRLEILRGDR